MKLNLRFVFFIFFVSVFFFKVYSQTSAVILLWDLDIQSEISHYNVYRSVNSYQNFQMIKSVIYPYTSIVDGENINPGNLYVYTVVTVAISGSQSDFSDIVSVGIPRINWSITEIPTNTVTSVLISDILEDPDNDISELEITFSELNHIQVVINGPNLELSPSPLTYSGPASFNMIVNDPSNYYDLKNIVLNNGQSSIFSSDHPPQSFILFQNYPNPFNPVTEIRYMLPRASLVKIDLYNVLGQKVKTLLNEKLPSGYHTLFFDAKDLNNGIYFYKMESEKFTDIKKLIILK